VWQARFGEHTPTHLIAALADPSPPARTGSPLNTPPRHPNLVTRTHREVPAAQIASALEERVHALFFAPRQPASEPERPATAASQE
jgi:hypothetical protein